MHTLHASTRVLQICGPTHPTYSNQVCYPIRLDILSHLQTFLSWKKYSFKSQTCLSILIISSHENKKALCIEKLEVKKHFERIKRTCETSQAKGIYSAVTIKEMSMYITTVSAEKLVRIRPEEMEAIERQHCWDWKPIHEKWGQLSQKEKAQPTHKDLHGKC